HSGGGGQQLGRLALRVGPRSRAATRPAHGRDDTDREQDRGRQREAAGGTPIDRTRADRGLEVAHDAAPTAPRSSAMSSFWPSAGVSHTTGASARRTISASTSTAIVPPPRFS